MFQRLLAVRVVTPAVLLFPGCLAPHVVVAQVDQRFHACVGDYPRSAQERTRVGDLVADGDHYKVLPFVRVYGGNDVERGDGYAVRVRGAVAPVEGVGAVI